MKISKIFNIIIVLFLLTVFLPPKEASAEWLVTTNVTLSTPTTAVRDWVITSGGVLTIQPGVTVTVNCSDGEPYASGTDPNKIEIIVEDGTLIADGVTFVGATQGTACWHGIRILGDGDAEITNSTIRDARIGISVEGSSPTISGNTIRNIRGADQTVSSFPQIAYGIWVYGAQPGLEIVNNTITDIRAGSGCNTCNSPNGRIAYGISVSDSNNVLIEGNSISVIVGGNGGTGAEGVDGANGADGTSPTSSAGQPGENGTNGQDGGEGGAAYGILVHSTMPSISAVLDNNNISSITGGNGAIGGSGGLGGNGGNGYDQPAPYMNTPTDGGFGGKGGNGGNGGNGGYGGNAYGIMGWNVITSIVDNRVNNIHPGMAGSGANGRYGGSGRGGGDGSPVQVTAPQVPAGYGGGGGFGGNGGAGGAGGNPGNGYGVAMEFGTLAEFSTNTIGSVLGKSASLGGQGTSGNLGGPGGTGGNGTAGYQKGGGGGDGGYGGSSGNGGNGGNGSSVYGLYMNNTTFTSINGNTISMISSGAGGNSGSGGTGSGLGGRGGNVGSNPDLVTSSVKGGRGGIGSAGGIGGNGGSAGYAYGMYIRNAASVGTLVNNLINNIEAKSGANGGVGGNGTAGGAGGTGNTKPGGNGGNGGAAGNGGAGGFNAGGASNAYGIMIEQTAGTTTFNMTVTNNTVATVKSTASTPAGGAKGTPGAGGAGGTGTPNGTAGSTGSAGGNGSEGWSGFAIGYYSGDRTNSSLYNNIVVSLEPTPTNSIGLLRSVAGSLNYFRTGNVWGWYMNYGSNLTGIDTEGSISSNPLFSDPESYKFRLQSTSPCLNTANNSAPATPAVDRDGVPRPLPAGGTVDMGAYEWGSYFRFSQSSMSVNEGDGTITVTIQQVGYLETAGQVNFTFTNGTATNGLDFSNGNSFVGFTAGMVSGTRTITPTIIDDFDIEGSETFQVSLSSPVGGALMDPSVLTVTIIDNDAFWIFLPLIIR